jgi:Domain of unknown function (DUF6265)
MKRAGFYKFCLLWVAVMALVLAAMGIPSSAAPSGSQPVGRYRPGAFSGVPQHPIEAGLGSVSFSRQAPEARPNKSSKATRSSPNESMSKPPQMPRPALSDFAWLEGKWLGNWGPRVAEQIWTAPKGGQMLGLFRVVANDKPVVIELFSLVDTPEGVELKFRHFTPALAPWEQSDAGLMTMKLNEFGPATLVFENAGDGQPRRAMFIRTDPDTYISKSEIVPLTGGAHTAEITYRRQK